MGGRVVTGPVLTALFAALGVLGAGLVGASVRRGAPEPVTRRLPGPGIAVGVAVGVLGLGAALSVGLQGAGALIQVALGAGCGVVAGAPLAFATSASRLGLGVAMLGGGLVATAMIDANLANESPGLVWGMFAIIAVFLEIFAVLEAPAPAP